MKIAIVSINAHTRSLNLACPIHSWAFQQFLFKHGIDNIILNYQPNYTHPDSFDSREPYAFFEALTAKQEKVVEAIEAQEDFDPVERKRIRKLWKLNRMQRDGYAALGKERAIRFDKKEDFVHKYLKMTEKVYTTASLETEDPGFDCYICASDVIWKFNEFDGFDLGFFLGSKAMDYKYKIAYAASRGVPYEYPEDQRKFFVHYLKDFDAIAAREQSVADDVKRLVGMDAPVVLDPVLLHDAKFYEKMLVKPKETNYVLLYSPEERTKNTTLAAQEYCKKHGKTLVEISSFPLVGGLLKGKYEVDHVFRYDVGPDEWLGYFKYADHVFTNSFHAVCFSILFKKQFTVGSRAGDKVSHLLELFGLTHRQIDKKGEFVETKKPPKASVPVRALRKFGILERPGKNDVYYPEVYRILKEERQKSEDYILGAIKSLEGKEDHKAHDYDAWRKSLCYKLRYYYSGQEVPEGLPEQAAVTNDGESASLPDLSSMPEFRGWHLMLRMVDNWYCLKAEEGQPAELLPMDGQGGSPEFLFAGGAQIPHIPTGIIDEVIARACFSNE